MAGNQWFESNRFNSSQAYPKLGQRVAHSRLQSPYTQHKKILETHCLVPVFYRLRHAPLTNFLCLKLILVGILSVCSISDVAFAQTAELNVTELSLQAREGDSVAQYNLADAYLSGIGLPKNPQRGLIWLAESANGGHVPAQLLLAHFYYTGLHTQQNTNLAMERWQQAADNQNADGQYKLATVLLNRSANDGDIETANELLRTAWSKGHQQAGDMLVALGLDLPEPDATVGEIDNSNTATVTMADITSQRPVAKQRMPELIDNSAVDGDRDRDRDRVEDDGNIADSDEIHGELEQLPTNSVTQEDVWIFSRLPNNYTIQLASFSDATAGDFFLRRNNLQAIEQLKTIRSADNQWTYVLLGVYPNFATAEQEAVAVSEKLEPWARSYASIQRNRCAQLKMAAPQRYTKYCQ